MITIEMLKAICPHTKDATLQQFIDPLNEVAEYYELNTPQRLAGFVAQCAHESGDFTAIKENLNYSAKGLMGTFHKYFPDEATAKRYERKSEMIANRVYANRMGNGDEASGDGYKHCGRGLIQLTGKQNYQRFAADLEMSEDDCVAYMETIEGAVSSAGWFWDNNNLNQYCDSGDFVMLTKRINGGTIGIEDRKHKYDLLINFLSKQ
jgi:putative chitinase